MQAFFVNNLESADATVVVLGTGGTIAGTAASAQDVLGYTAGQVGVAALLNGVAGLHSLDCGVEAEQIAQVDSKDMDYAVWQHLAQRIEHHLLRSNVVGVVITHGTDTVEETAFFLQAVLPRSLVADKPVVLTCAMRPATATDADGPQNLLDALRLASGQPMRQSAPSSPAVSSTPALRGVVVVCAGVVHSSRAVQKVHPTRLDPFDSGDVPILGRISPQGVYEANLPLTQEFSEEVVQEAGHSEGRGWAQERSFVLPPSRPWPRVEIVLNHAGAGGAMVDALMAQNAMCTDPIRGLVIAGTGNGSVRQSLLAALLRAQAQGVKVVRCSRCATGSVVAVAGHPLPDISTLSPVKARIRLMLNLIAPSSSPCIPKV